MRNNRYMKSTLSLLAAAMVSFSSGVHAEGNYVMGTATTGGTYYPVGVAISTLVKVKLEPTTNISVSAISSAGSGENLKLMDEGQIQFGILQGLYGAYAWNGTGPVPQAYKNLRSVSMLWQNVEHFVVRNNVVETGTISDMTNLYDESFSIGARNSGTEGSGRFILGKVGIDLEQVDIAYLGYGPSADAMQNGNIDGMNIPAGVPASAVTRAYANLGGEITTLDFTEAQLAEVNSDFELWTPYLIPAGTYPNQDKDINTIAGEAAEGLLVTLPPAFDQKAENQALVKAFQDKGEDPSGPFVLTSYTAVQLVAEGIEAADSTDPFDVAAALREGTFQTPIGTVEYDKAGDMKSFEFVVYEWHSDGSKTPVN